MSKKYKLSVVVLVYNTEPYIRDCLDSLVNQTLKELEIIMVNDESQDHSVDIIEEYQQMYPNIRLVNQENSGGAIAGNNGLKVAQGEYVTLMDSDDIVPSDAYEKLYKKAKETDADIVIGKAKIIQDGIIKEVIYPKEREVWKEEREITDLLQYPDIFYDGFYWNKIYKREFLFKYDCFMPPGMLYADRPMVHKAFLYAKKIEIITDLVYLWRKRGETLEKSITQLKGDINNFRDRMESLYYQMKYIEEFGHKQIEIEFLKRNLDRLFFPIMSIVSDKEFRDFYIEEVREFLSKADEVFNVYDNDIGITKNLYIYMILNGMTNELVEFLQIPNNGSILEEDGIYYWALPYFRNPDVKIPDEFFQVKVLQSQFIKIERLETTEHSIQIKNITIPDVFSVERAVVEVISKKDQDNKIVYNLMPNENNNYSGEIPFDDHLINGIFDIYVVFYTEQGEERFRITKKMFVNPFKKIELFTDNLQRRLFFEGGKLAYLVIDIHVNQILLDETRVCIDVFDAEIDDLTFFLKTAGSKDKIYFHKRDEGKFELPLRHFIERNRTFDIYMRVYRKSVRLHQENVPGFNSQTLKTDGLYYELFKTNNNTISLRFTTPVFRTISRWLVRKG